MAENTNRSGANMSGYFERVEAHLLDAVERNAPCGVGRHKLRDTLGRRRWAPRWMALVAGSLASVGAVVALGLLLGAGASTPAYAVVVRPDGSVTLTLNELVGVGSANARLAELGVRARLAKVEPGCATKARPIPWWRLDPAPQTARHRAHRHETRQIRRERLLHESVERSRAAIRLMMDMARPEKSGHGPGGVRMVIQPSEIPAGDTLLLVFKRVGGSHTRDGKSVEAVGGSIGLWHDPAPTCLPQPVRARN
jgi:hypothetical protein